MPGLTSISQQEFQRNQKAKDPEQADIHTAERLYGLHNLPSLLRRDGGRQFSFPIKAPPGW